MKSIVVLALTCLSVAAAFSSVKQNLATHQLRASSFRPSSLKVLKPLSAVSTDKDTKTAVNGATKEDKEETAVSTELVTNGATNGAKEETAAVTTELASTKGSISGAELLLGEDEDWVADSKTVELVLLGIWLVSISAFILINNFSGPWPLVMKQVPERVYFLSHMIGGMLFGGGIILTTCIERLVANSKNAPVLQFWFDKVPLLDGLIVVPALTVSMISGTGLTIVRYGGLNIAPPHVGAIFWTLILFMSWWAATDLTTQGTALEAVNEMYDSHLQGEEGLETPKVVVDRHISNTVSCFFILLLYSMMVLKPGTLFPFPWADFF